MKIFLYFVLIIAFLIFYQREPVIAGVFFVLFVVVFLFFKIRKSKGTGSSRFLHKGLDQMNENSDNLLFFFMMQQYFRSDDNTAGYSHAEMRSRKREKWDEKEEYLNATKERIFDLLDGKL